MYNPLLSQFDLPPFSLISSEHMECAIDVVVEYCYKVVEEVLSKENLGWETFCYPILCAENQLQRVWSPIMHLHAVQNTVELRRIYKKSKAIVDDYTIWLNQHRGLYVAYSKLCSSDCYAHFDRLQKKFVKNILNRFKLSGIELSTSKKQRYKEINKRLCQLSNIYDDNVLDATESWKKLIVDKEKLFGLSEYDLKIAKLEAEKYGKNGWLLTLRWPSYLSVMRCCEDRLLREEVYWAYNTRASEEGPYASCWDNTSIIHEILSLRYELASRVLGFSNYVESVLVTRMVRTLSGVLHFFESISDSIYSHACGVFLHLQKFVKKYYGCNELQPWDILFYIEKRRSRFFSLSESELRCFFPVHQVLQGMFTIANYLYGIKICERHVVDVWSADVCFFDVFDRFNRWLGGFYLDIYAREYKFSGAWMEVCTNMMRGIHDGIKQYPIAYLVCNFNNVQCSGYFLLSHDEVSILFHEFGHVLHHILTVVDIPPISGVNNVVLDASEVPSQFMEKFSWDPCMLEIITGHSLTGQSLSKGLIMQLVKYKRYESSFFLLYQLIYSIFDIRVHSECGVTRNFHFMNVFNDIKKKLLIFPTIDWDRFPHTFSHIFSCDYAAGYYSYLWSDVLASDIWFRFKKADVLDFSVGALFLEHILARGGSEEFSDLIFQFFGRESCTRFFLRYYYGI